MKKNKNNSKNRNKQPTEKKGPLKELKPEQLEQAGGGWGMWGFGFCDMDGYY
jgi:hypothetical protein